MNCTHGNVFIFPVVITLFKVILQQSLYIYIKIQYNKLKKLIFCSLMLGNLFSGSYSKSIMPKQQ